ncbi:zinc finger protein-domain-containing protein [Penicillium argentinense]|uniref:Zinc finger protein-domain-containing protein n=1 Tax=Penicillium argentinense TaxID=1131581 RepID=A0A9W9FGZ5_9EURO|nr:zinc finger protein-domain-containing protein [Penicillium argentinense]KAJ5100001.1 zinc finger protein-domain-containing protein [Penicillium argentinense]
MEVLRRGAQHSSEDSPVSMSSSLRVAVYLSNQLSALLDQEHNDTIIRELELQECSSPDTILAKVLTPQSISSTSSSFAQFQNSQQSLPVVEYRAIGFGQCGLIFEKPGHGFALKIAKRSYEDALWNDLTVHLRIQEAFDQPQNKDSECRVPRLFSYISKDSNVWWEQNLSLFRNVHASISLPAMTLVSQRILPLPKIAREILINKYCAAASRAFVAANPTNRDCLARIYLGSRRATKIPPPNFTLRNFNIYVDQLVEMKFPIEKLAASIGEALAIIHWSANVDAYDIEFVLGSEADSKYSHDVLADLNLTSRQVAAMPPHTDLESIISVNFLRRTTRLWIIDFNLCHSWDEDTALNHPEALIEQLVESFFENDPYYPLPLVNTYPEKELWELFSSSYITKASKVLHEKDRRLACLPQQFINGCIQREIESLQKGLGHGHRETRQ